MLAALLLIGILPLAALPLFQTTEEDEDLARDDAPADATAETSLIDLLDGPIDIEPDEGALHIIEASPGETVIDAFQPGVDMVELDLSAVPDGVTFDTAATAEGATISFLVGEGVTTTVEFPGLSEVPTGDIMVRLLDEETGEIYESSLTDAAAMENPGVTQAEILDPVDPETPDNADNTTVEADTVLDPVDPDLPDGTGPDVVGPVLDPVDPESENTGSDMTMDLRALLERDSENLAGLDQALEAAARSGVVDTVLGDGDDSLQLAGDDVGLSGEGALTMLESVPVVGSGSGSPIEVVDGGAGDDEITTGDAPAFAFGAEGNDTLVAGGGAAALYGGAGDDDLSATASDAYLDGGAGDDLINGGIGNDVLEGGEHGPEQTAGADTIQGGAGDDTIRGGYGADLLSGGTGDDVIDHLGRVEEREILSRHEFAWHIDGASDTLDGGDGNDTLIFDRTDTATGGSGNDLFWLYHDGVDGGDVAEVTDFVVGQDFLRVSLNPQIGENAEPQVQVQTSADGSDGLVIVNGDLVAILRGAPGATVSDVYAEVQADVFP